MKIKVENFEDDMKKFSRVLFETRKAAKRHEYYLRPGIKAKEKSKEAKKNLDAMKSKTRRRHSTLTASTTTSTEGQK